MSDKLREFAEHVLQEQLEHGANGDAEYISMATEALEESGYQGWTNRETWAAHLHLTNDPDTYRMARGRSAEQIKAMLLELERDASDYTHGTNAVLRDIGSLWRVNWDEIASALRDSE